MESLNQHSAKKSLGQHWLEDESILKEIAGLANLKKTDTVLEIGPGHGTLTMILADSVKQVVAVEKDEELAKSLLSQIHKHNVSVVIGDILKFDLTTLPDGYKIVANIPYYLTSKLIRNISESINPPSRAILLVQKEVAERIAAAPGAMSLLSVTAQYYWNVALGPTVGREKFSPPPKVDSQVVVLSKKPQMNDTVYSKELFRVVKAGFSQRRKTLLNSMSAGLRISKSDVQMICKKADIESNRRSQTLSLDEWIVLYRQYTRVYSSK
jgi:16S rRNA (adenine1518-N6/adenine1519-N6)-dimethyltransferase